MHTFIKQVLLPLVVRLPWLGHIVKGITNVNSLFKNSLIIHEENSKEIHF